MSIPKFFIGYSNLNEDNYGDIKKFSKSIWKVSRQARPTDMQVFKVKCIPNYSNILNSVWRRGQRSIKVISLIILEFAYPLSLKVYNQFPFSLSPFRGKYGFCFNVRRSGNAQPSLPFPLHLGPQHTAGGWERGVRVGGGFSLEYPPLPESLAT